MKKINKTYIDNSRFMEFIDEMATQITEMNFREETWNVDELEKLDEGYKLTDEAQEYYNEIYDEYEMMANEIMGVYSDNEKEELEQ
jgi:ribosome assembly protein YihI (activator of Der GTPase)